ncbi:MAG: AtpZ/AtpI family protein [Acidobacteria bacterium]|jgi:F0F1-type ATP synthase assembly protein I|nr:AtpZ/AtpI family protein [Acidobacteriota bacterium]
MPRPGDPTLRPGRLKSLDRSMRAFQENMQRAGPAATASYTLIGGIVLLGGLGYLADGWWQTSPWLFLTGLFVGIVVGFYSIVMSTIRR